MIERNELKKFLGSTVTIGIPHFFDPIRLFYYTGELKKVTPNTVLIQLSKGGFREIRIDHIIELQPRRTND